MKTPIKHLHTEVKELKVRDHLDLLSSQYLASALCRSHLSHTVVTLPPGPRQKKKTLYSKCIGNVQRHLNDDDILLDINYKKTISAIHTAAVSKAVCAQGALRLKI
jgi:hypothetical protein